MQDNQNMYNSYHALTSEISENSKRMSEVCRSIGMNQMAEILNENRIKLQSHKFAVGILGEFRRGKSTVINAMLGREIMPSDIVPTTATMNRVSYGLTPYAELDLDDGSTKRIDVNELSSYVTKLDDETTERASHVNEAIVYYPCEFCRNGVDIVDTPGLNDDERMNRITEETIPKLDAVIMVLVPESPFSMSEAEFVRNKLMSSDVGRLIFLVNKIDTVRRAKDREKLVEDLKKRIRKTVLDRTAEVYGTDSEYYINVERKLKNISIYPISALDALDGRLENDDELVQKSGMLEFEKSLSYMLTEERGMLEIMPQITRLISAGTEVINTITIMQGSLEIDDDTFQQTQNGVLNQIRSLKKEKESKMKEIRNMASRVRQELSQKAEKCYEQIEYETSSMISSIMPGRVMSEQEKKDLFTNTIQNIQNRIDDILSIHAERLADELNSIIEEAGTDIAVVISRGHSQLNKHFDTISETGKKSSGVSSAAASDAAAVALETATTYLGIVGIGGIIRGYRLAGAKGAAVGGVAGALITYGAVAGLAAVLPAVSLPIILLTSVAGTYGGSAIAGALFAKDRANKQIDELKTELKLATSDAITKMRINREMEKWITAEVTNQFDTLIEDMDAEFDRVIDEADRKIKEIERNLYIKDSERKNQELILTNMSQNIMEIINTLKTICNDLETKAEGVNRRLEEG